MKPIKYGSSWKSNANGTMNVAQEVVSPAANARGMYVWRAGFFSQKTSGTVRCALIAKAGVPTSNMDGDVILGIETWGAVASSNYAVAGKLERPVFIPAGKGLYFIGDDTEVQSQKHVLYDLL